jgi:hypothetical protein
VPSYSAVVNEVFFQLKINVSSLFFFVVIFVVVVAAVVVFFLGCLSL